MSVDRALVLARLASTPGLLQELTRDATAEQAARPPAPGAWSLIEVVRHLVEGDRDTFLPRLRRMLTESGPRFAPVVPAGGDASDLPTLVAAFASARREVSRLLGGLGDDDWRRQGVSPSRGPLTVEAYARSMDAHDTEHLQQLQDGRDRLGLRPKRCEARAPLPLAELTASLATAAGRLRAVAAGLDEAQRRARPAPDEWGLNETMAHLLHVETEVFLPRLRRLLAEEHPVLSSFTPELWAGQGDHGAEPFEASLAAFGQAREETLAFLAALPPDAGERVGISAFFGPVTLRQYATHIADHDLEHLDQMARVRSVVLVSPAPRSRR